MEVKRTATHFQIHNYWFKDKNVTRIRCKNWKNFYYAVFTVRPLTVGEGGKANWKEGDASKVLIIQTACQALMAFCDINEVFCMNPW